MARAPLNSDAAIERSVALRMRPELEIRPQWFGRRRFWVVKDPVSLEYHQLNDEEHAILKMLDGRTSLAELQRGFQESFAPRTISSARLQTLLGLMHREGLVVSDITGQGEQLLSRRKTKRRRRWAATLTNILAIRLPGMDPERFLQWLHLRLYWIFSSWCIAACLLMALATLASVAVRFDEVTARLPDLATIFSAENVILLGCTLAGVKVLHELGHALTCKHFGGECHEMGVMFLVFTPCLYCNVTDSWMIANKWRRIAVSAAGIYVEVVLASLAAFLWLWSEPGRFNTVCLYVLLICTASTLLLNGNPLLRFDGYFVAADLLETPNLWQRSRGMVFGLVRRVCLGVELEADRARPRGGHGLVFIYGIASIAYRVIVIFAILWFLYSVLKPHGLEAIAFLVALVAFAGVFMVPLFAAARLFRDPSIRRRISRRRVALTMAGVLGLLIMVVLVPVPHSVQAPVVVQARDAQRVYVSEPGILQQTTLAGTQVKAGQTLAVLSAPELAREVARLNDEVRYAQIRLRNLEMLRVAVPEIADQVALQIPAAEETLDDKKEQLKQRSAAEKSLVLRSPQAGTVLAPPFDRDAAVADDELPFWSGSLLEERSLGCYLESGTLLCMIGDPARHELAAYITQDDVEWIRLGQSVRVLLEQQDGEVLHGEIASLAKVDSEVAPKQVAAMLDRSSAGETDSDGIIYEATVLLEEHDRKLIIGARGRARITVKPLPIGKRFVRFLSRTFAFRL